MDAITEIGTVEFLPSQRERWVAGQLATEWAAKFPQLFDDDDLQQAINQPRNHFYEWLAAIVLHHTTGYYALVEKYEFQNHRRMRDVVERLLPTEVLAVLNDRSEHGHAQAPDLLMYAPDYSDWFFCEVKGPRDRIRDDQRRKFEVLAAMTDRPVRRLSLRTARATPLGGLRQ